MKLQPRLLFAGGGMFALCAAISLMVSYRSFDTLLTAEMRKEAETILGVLMATRRVYHKQFVASDLPVNDQTVGFLPAHAMARISRDFPNWSNSGIRFNNVSDRSRNPDNRADTFEMEAIAWFRANPKSKDRIGEITAADGQSYYHYTKPIWVEEYCLKCHGRRADAPESITSRYADAYDYRVGDLRGVMSIKIPVASLREQLWAMWRDQALAYLLGLALLFGTLAWVIRRTVTHRLSRLERTARQLQAGEYGGRDERTAPDDLDEIGTLAASLNQMADAVQQREIELRGFAEISAHHLQEPARRQRHLLSDIERYLAAGTPRGPLCLADASVSVAQWQQKMEADIAAAGATIHVDALPAAWIDAPRLADLFKQALDNALWHGKNRPWRDGASLTILVAGERLIDTVRYTVSDNGPGIEADYRKRVFRIFERLTNTGEGTGIGLAIARRIAESGGGRIWIEEAPGGGCRLLFELPGVEPR